MGDRLMSSDNSFWCRRYKFGDKVEVRGDGLRGTFSPYWATGTVAKVDYSGEGSIGVRLSESLQERWAVRDVDIRHLQAPLSQAQEAELIRAKIHLGVPVTPKERIPEDLGPLMMSEEQETQIRQDAMEFMGRWPDLQFKTRYDMHLDLRKAVEARNALLLEVDALRGMLQSAARDQRRLEAELSAEASKDPLNHTERSRLEQIRAYIEELNDLFEKYEGNEKP